MLNGSNTGPVCYSTSTQRIFQLHVADRDQTGNRQTKTEKERTANFVQCHINESLWRNPLCYRVAGCPPGRAAGRNHMWQTAPASLLAVCSDTLTLWKGVRQYHLKTEY